MITPLQILLFYTKSKYMHIFIFTLLYLQRIKPLQYINPPIIVCLPKRSVGLHPDAIFDDYFSKNPTNNGVFIKYRTQKPLRRYAFLLLRQDIITSRSKTKSKISFSRRKVCQPLRAAFAIPYILKDLSLKSPLPQVCEEFSMRNG